MLVLRDLVGVEPLGGLYRPLSRRPESARAPARVGQGGRRARRLAERLRRRRRLLGAGRACAGHRPGDRRADPERRRQARPARWLVPAVVPSSARCAGSGGGDGSDGRSRRRLPSRTPRSRRRGSSSSPRAPARARRPSSSSASPARSTRASTSRRSSSSPTPSARPPSCARGSARGSPSSAGQS